MKKIPIIIFAVLLAAAIAFFGYTMSKKPETAPEIKEPTPFSVTASDYTAALSFKAEEGKKYLASYIPDVFYTADLEGNIGFYRFESGSFKPLEQEVKELSIKLNASAQNIPLKVKYIELDGQVLGFGLFTSDMDKSVDLYDYVFVQLRNMPVGYGGELFLLADYDKEDFYKTDKIYNELCEVSLSSSSAGTRLSQNTRLIDRNGTYRQDWSLLTDEFLRNTAGKKLFMSSRYYTQAETGIRTDIMEYSYAYRPTVIAKDIVGDWFTADENGLHYIKKTDDGFKTVTVTKDEKTNKNKTEDGIKFTGDYFTGYLRSGNYLLNKADKSVTNLLTGAAFSFDPSCPSLTGATAYAASSDGTKAAIAFPGKENSEGVPIQKLIYIQKHVSRDTQADDCAVYEEPLLWCEESDFIWLDPDHCMSVKPLSDDGLETGSVIYTF